MKLLNIIQKNFKILFRSKISALIVFLGPLLLILLVGLAFNNAAQAKISIGVYSPKYTDLAESLLKKFQDNKYDVTRLNSEQECIDALKYSTIHACLIFPADFVASTEKSSEITFYADYSEINLVYIILDIIGRQVIAESTDISADLVSRLVNKIEDTKLKLNAHKNILMNFNQSEVKAKAQLDAVSSDLGTMNMSFDFGLLSTAPMVSQLNQIDSSASQIKSLLSSITGELQGENVSGIVFSDIDEASNITDAIKSYVKGQTSSGNSSNSTQIDQSLQTMINSLGNSILSLKSEFDKANMQKQSVSMDVNKALSILSNNFDYISDLFKETDDMIANIETLKITNTTVIAAPITTKIKSITKEGTHFNYLFPLLITLTMMITGILLASTIVITEKRSKAFFRNHISPTQLSLFSLGTYFTSLIVIGMQLLIFIITAAYLFKIDLMANIATTLIVLFVMITLYIVLGMMIGSFFKSAETSALGAVTFSSILLFFSKAILPLENMPDLLRSIAQFNPFVINIDLLNKSIFFNMQLDILWGSLKYIMIYIAVIGVLLVVVQRILRSYMLFKIHKAAPTPKEIEQEQNKLEKLS